MTFTEANSLISDLTGQDTTSFTNAKRALYADLWMGKVVSMLLDSGDDAGYDDPRHGDFPVQRADLVSGQRTYSFAVSDGVVRFERVDVSYDGSTYVQAVPIDESELTYLSLGDGETAAAEDAVDAHFSRSAPRYDVRGGFTVALYPRPAATAGKVVVRVSRTHDPITAADLAGSEEPGFDRNFHFLIPYGAAYEFASAHQLPNRGDLAAVLADGEARLRRQYGRRQPERRMALTAVGDLTDYS